MAETETSVHDFNILIGKPRVILNNKYVAIETTGELVAESNKLLRNHVDKLMLRFRESDTEFYSGYERARTIVD